MGDLRAQPDLDLSVYTSLARALNDLADGIETGVLGRRRHRDQAEESWRGTAVAAFADRFVQGETDAGELIIALRHAAQLLAGPQETSLLEAGRRENQRRATARAWLAERDRWEEEHDEDGFRGFLQDVGNWFTSDDWESRIGPMPSPVPEPEPRLVAPVPPAQRVV